VLKARVIRFLFGLHRWMGVVLGLLMLMWCLSGIVMIWQPYPSMRDGRHDLRVEGLAPIALPATTALPPADIAKPDAKLRSARIEMMADRPVLRLAVQGGGGVYDLTTGAKIETIAEPEALAIAATYAKQHGIDAKPSLKRIRDKPDEFTVSGEINAPPPLYEIRLNDAAGTLLYISAKTGQVRQRTTSAVRVWSWLGPIPHWLYFVELRKNGKLWTDVIIWTSLAGCFLTVLGLFVGLRQFRRRHSTGKLASPYHGAKFWHHMIGLVFGVLVLTWTFSGFASMNPWGWLETTQPAGEAADRLTGERPDWNTARPALEAQLAALKDRDGKDLALTSSVSQGELNFIATRSDGGKVRLGADGFYKPYEAAEQQRAAQILSGGKDAKVELLTKEDDYWYEGSTSGQLPVVRITVPSLDARFYVDRLTGDIVGLSDPGTNGYRFWHLGLHRIDFFGWLRIHPIRDIVLVLLMLGVSAVCALGAYMGIRKLMRGGRLDNTPRDQPQAD
jgi:uncharacterized iron-regulated membrane protein